ncbi:hypothetical protein HHI36_019925 [Cryptolaemus montrouzieri]|uniref:Uncharacterized protein n=1 Tax=Cryptolaemus montrouzieri TaxID=559131 RepID=A0ABD2NAC3_9CUCU
MNTGNSESGSDISSNSSWTVIEEIEICAKPNLNENLKHTKNSLELIRTTEILEKTITPKSEENEFVKVSFSDESIKTQSTEDEDSHSSKEQTKDNGFLTFDEYLQERLLEHDYEYPNQSVVIGKLKKSKKFSRVKRMKCKSETIGVLSLCASLLTVTGIALLCLVFPESIENKNFDSIVSNYQAIVNNDSLDFNNISASFNKTMQILDIANSTKMLAKCSNSLMETNEYEKRLYRRRIGPMKEEKSNKEQLNRKYNNRLSRTNIFRNDICYSRDKSNVCYPTDNPKFLSESFKNLHKSGKAPKSMKDSSSNLAPTKSVSKTNNTTSLSTLQSVLGKTNLRSIIRSIIHDLCMLKLITHFNNSKKYEEPKRRSEKGEKKSSKRGLLEAIADGIDIINLEGNKNRKVKVAKRKTKSKKYSRIFQETPTETCMKVTHPSTLKSDITPSSSEYDSVKMHEVNSLETKPSFENGKSECERRFEELDNQRKLSKDVCTKHRFNIQHIKQLYRSELNALKISNIEPIVRLHKMQTVRENYRLQLKRNREFYMRELYKMKRIRAKMLRDICNQKKNELELRDASVGSYVVPMYEDFYTRLQKIKEKADSSSSQNTLTVQDNSKNQVESMIQLKNPIEQHTTKVSNHFSLPQQSSYNDYSTNEIIVRSRSSVNVNGTNINSSANISHVFKNLNKNHTDLSTSKTEKYGIKETKIGPSSKNNYSGESVEKDSSIMSNKNLIQMNLYRIAFEKRGETIKKSDELKWRPKFVDWEAYRKDLSKQNPQKSLKPNIVLHKN